MTVRSRFATQDIATAIADEQPVDWSPAERALGPDDPALANLRLIDDVARAFRSAGTGTRHERQQVVLFRWGPLEVIERLGEGLTGEVFRAYDPALQRDVALKLRAARDPLSDPANAQVLAEARQLACVRQRNVLAVYGTDVHDGRAGVWSELIDGRTLADIVADDGPLSAEETVAIGLDLCRALGTVHGAGLIHGDVKAENVMRERGGRIVLMDFGASGQASDHGRVLISGTRRYLAPELLAGTARSARSDLYALAVLLYHLLCGSYPRDNDAAAPMPLAQHRPELPAALAAVVDGALAENPAARPQNAAVFARTLLALLPTGAERHSHRRFLALATAAALALAIAAIALLRDVLWPPAWAVSARFLDPATGAVITDGMPVRLGDALVLQLRTTRPSHVYVLNEDADGELTLLFPVLGLDRGNPIPAGGDIELPGSGDGQALSWEISSPSASEEFVVIASAQALPDLAARLAAADRAQFPVPTRIRGADRLRAAPPQALAIEGQALAELVALARDSAIDPEHLHVQVLRLPHAR